MKEIVEELASQLPVKQIYEDAGKPAAKQTGAIGEDIMKCLHLVLAPVQYGAALQDRFKSFLDESVRKVPEDRRISPAPQILGPILEGIRYEPEGTELSEMASNLLATSMDQENVWKAHPSYPKLIQQLSRDEIVILKLLLRNRYYQIIDSDLVTVDSELGGKRSGFNNHRLIEDNFPKEELHHKNNLSFYINHLHSLGLAGMRRGDAQRIPVDGNLLQTGERIKDFYIITDIGAAFADACQL